MSGLANLAALTVYALLHTASVNQQQRVALVPNVGEGFEVSEAFPQFPTPGSMTSVEIAARTKRLVSIVTPDIGIDPQRESLGIAQTGASVDLSIPDNLSSM